MKNKDLINKIKKKEHELRFLELQRLIEEDKYKSSMLIQHALVRSRFIFEIKNRQPLILDGRDFEIVDQFANKYNLPEGRGLKLYFELFLNYYKSKKWNQN